MEWEKEEEDKSSSVSLSLCLSLSLWSHLGYLHDWYNEWVSDGAMMLQKKYPQKKKVELMKIGKLST
jgi:hypothetical protein